MLLLRKKCVTDKEVVNERIAQIMAHYSAIIKALRVAYVY